MYAKSAQYVKAKKKYAKGKKKCAKAKLFLAFAKKKFALHEFYLNFCKFSYKCLYLQTNLGREGGFLSKNLDNLLDANRLGYVINMQNFNVKIKRR